MAQMIRKQVYIEPRQDQSLKRLAKARGVTEAEIIRRAIDRETSFSHVDIGQSDPAAWEEARAFIRSLIAKGAVPGGRKWRREDVYEERLSRYGRR